MANKIQVVAAIQLNGRRIIIQENGLTMPGVAMQKFELITENATLLACPELTLNLIGYVWNKLDRKNVIGRMYTNQ